MSGSDVLLSLQQLVVSHSKLATNRTSSPIYIITPCAHLVDDAAVLHDALRADEAEVDLLHDRRHSSVEHHFRRDAAVREQPRALQAAVCVEKKSGYNERRKYWEICVKGRRREKYVYVQ